MAGIVDRRGKLEDEVFSSRAAKNGSVMIYWSGRVVTTLSGARAAAFIAKAATANPHDAQLLMAKATGHFKHGNERQ
jgi:hypothetical protein